MVPTLRRLAARSPFTAIDLSDADLSRVLERWCCDPNADLVGSYPVDIREDDDHIYVEAELPGFKKKEVDVTLEKGRLTIAAQRQHQEEKKGEKHLTERRCSRVSRTFTIPTTVDENRVEASLDGGVLHLTLNKREEVKPRRVEIH